MIQTKKHRESVKETDQRNSPAAIGHVPPRVLERSRQTAILAAQALAENGGLDVVVLDMSGLTALFDFFVIATGNSQRHLYALADDVDAKLKAELNDRRMSTDGETSGRWVVMDYGTVVVHLFDEETRQFYSLEALWGDAPRIDLNRVA